ncbi:MAG: alpha/beta fold hydrolase, partial [Pseudomonadota bacterium]|nr:alpha/beta fold hydrolase [Pseudomonadota bacterium]
MRIFAAAAALLCAGALCYPTTASAAASAEQRLAHISIATAGHGTPVVLIPGLGSPRDVWGPLVAQLARNHRLFLVQVNGFGGSEPGANLQPGVLDGIVADVHAYLAARHIGAAPVIGHSMGGLA